MLNPNTLQIYEKGICSLSFNFLGSTVLFSDFLILQWTYP